MNSDQRAFLDRIADAPEDDTNRLVFADFLEERGEIVRADAIRRGVAKPKRFTFAEGAPAILAYTSERREVEYGRAQVTLERGWDGLKWTTYKGLIESATVSWEAWVQSGDLIHNQCFLPMVVLKTAPQTLIITGPSLDYTFGAIPGRKHKHRVPFLESGVLNVLRGEWPQVKRWAWPHAVHFATEVARPNGRPLITMHNASAKPGDVVKLADGNKGRLVGEIGADGYGCVTPLPRDSSDNSGQNRPE